MALVHCELTLIQKYDSTKELSVVTLVCDDTGMKEFHKGTEK